MCHPLKFVVGGREIGTGERVFVVAEMSGNHGNDYERAKEMIYVAAAAGVDAVKLQTYTADTITISCNAEHFKIKKGPWAGHTLHQLYEKAHTPWSWHPGLKELGVELGVEVFSTPFDSTSVDFLEGEVGVNVYKIASFEVVDIPLLRKVARTGKPVIISTGMATLGEIDSAVRTLRETGCPMVALLRCVSCYPATPEQMNLATIPHLAKTFSCIAGVSDHTLSPAVAVTAVALGASIVEKHFTLSRAGPGTDAAFSLEPDELRLTVEMIRQAEAAIGNVSYGAGAGEEGCLALRKSLFVVEGLRQGEPFTEDNVRAIRPADGLSPAVALEVFGRMATRDIKKGSPLEWSMVGARASGGM